MKKYLLNTHGKYLKFIPIRVKYRYDKDAIGYIGYSDKFAEVSEHDEIPEYKIFIENGEVKL